MHSPPDRIPSTLPRPDSYLGACASPSVQSFEDYDLLGGSMYQAAQDARRDE